MILEFRNTTVFRDGIPALRNFSRRFDSAETPRIAVTGSNGAGKSTLLETVLGLLSPSEGAVFLDGRKITGSALPDVRRKIGMIFQNPDDQLFSQTVREDVSFGPRNLRLAPAEIGERTRAALERMGIAHLADRDISHLSGGEKRRAALAGVLAMKPDGVLLDEPTSMLDPRGCRILAEYLAGLPIFQMIATHDLEFAAKVCPHWIVLRDGRLAAEGSPEKILADRDLLVECGLA